MEEFGFERVRYCFETAEESDFLKGSNNHGRVATFDWLIMPENIAKVINGNYASVYSKPSPDDGLESSFESDEFIEAALSRPFF